MKLQTDENLEIVFACGLLIQELKRLVEARNQTDKKRKSIADRILEADKIFEGLSKDEINQIVAKL